jgi:hypothetical protein
MDYNLLTVAERVSLTIQAISSSNISEAKRLMDTCSKEQVEVTNLEYLNTTRMLCRVAHTFESDMRGIALTMAGNMSNAGADILGQCLDQVASAKAAWKGFCSSYGLTTDELIKAAGGHHPTVSNMMMTTLDPVPALVEQWRHIFAMAASGEVMGETRH